MRAALATLAGEGRIADRGLHGRFAMRARDAGGTSLFAETVVVLSHMSEELAPGRLPGALLAIDAGFVEATRGARLTPLLVHLSSLSLEAAADRWRARLLSAPPAAVVFGARAFQLQTKAGSNARWRSCTMAASPPSPTATSPGVRLRR